MSEQTNDNGHDAQSGKRQRYGRGRGCGPLAVLFVALIAAASGAFATKAVSHGFGHWRHAGFMHGPVDPAKVGKRAQRMAKHLAVEVDATAEQQEKLVSIAKTLANDLLPLREKIWTARQNGRTLFTQAVIDREAIENFRVEQITLADTVTKRITKAFADAADILTAEQRKELSERFPGHHRFGKDRN
ncbi:MAG: Spy/CpxP family protein refolding chaperone [Methyloligellaceae bacterium]